MWTNLVSSRCISSIIHAPRVATRLVDANSLGCRTPFPSIKWAREVVAPIEVKNQVKTIRIYPVREQAKDSARTLTQRDLKSWASVLMWAAKSDCDRVTYDWEQGQPFVCFKSGEVVTVKEVIQPPEQIRQRLKLSLLRTVFGMRVLGYAFMFGFKAKVSDLMAARIEVATDEAIYGWGFQNLRECMTFTLKDQVDSKKS